MGFGPTWISLNFENQLDRCLDTKKKSEFSHLLIIMCLGGGVCSLSALVDIFTYMIIMSVLLAWFVMVSLAARGVLKM